MDHIGRWMVKFSFDTSNNKILNKVTLKTTQWSLETNALSENSRRTNNNCFDIEKSEMCSHYTAHSTIDSANVSLIANKYIVLCFVWLCFLLLCFCTFFRVWSMAVLCIVWKRKKNKKKTVMWLKYVICMHQQLCVN